MKRYSTTKLFKLTRRALVLALSCLLSIASHANVSPVLETPIQAISINDAPFEQALKQIEQQANIQFVYSLNTLQVYSRITFHADHTKLGTVLNEVLTPLNISYKVYEAERSITLQKNETKDKSYNRQGANESTPSTAGLELLVTGQVTDAATRSPIAGANIIIRGTTNGTTSDQDGRFSIKANSGDRLVISFIGYKPTEVEINDATELSIALQEDIASLDEVVVNAGYWDVSRKEQTGNIAKVDSKEIARTPASNVAQALQGRMAGVYIQQTTGTAGGGFNIQIRGQNSLRNAASNNGNAPLYIVDGVPFSTTQVGSTSIGGSIVPQASPLSSINPNDIESIEVLKDADATAIYGSRGANGVVLITTKKGSTAGTRFDINVTRGFTQVARRMELLSSSQYNAMRLEAFRNDNSLSQLVPANINVHPDVLRWDTTRYTDWQKELIGQTASTLNAQGSISGGTERTHFLATGSVYRETTVFPGSFSYQRASGLFNFNHTSNDRKFELNVSSNFSLSNNDLPSLDLTDQAMILPPVAPALRDENGNINWEGGSWTNPLSQLLRKYRVKTKLLMSNASLSYNILPGLKMKTHAGYSTMQSEQLATNPIAANNPLQAGVTGNSTFGSGSLDTWILEPQVDYQKKAGDGNFSAIIGSTIQQNIAQTQTILANGYTSDALIENIQSAPSVSVSGATFAQYRYAAVFGRLFYSWKERYLLNLTARRDGSSRFGPGRQFANFGAVGAGWLFSSEDFIKRTLPFITFGKLRGSYGLTGSDQIGDYQYFNTFSSTSLPYNGITGLVPNRLVNPDFAWETNRKLEFGIELAILQDRLNAAVSWFRNISSNQLVGYPLPRTTGQSSIQYNLDATVENKGWEIEVSSTNVKLENFSWQTSFNMTVPVNTLLKYPNIEASPYATTLEVGKPLYLRRSTHLTGVDPQSGRYTFEDVNNNGNTLFDTPGDLIGLKTVSQKYFGGMQNVVQWRSISLSFLFQFVKQTGRNYLASFNQSPGSASNQPAFVMDRWMNPGDQVFIQRFSQSFPLGANSYSAAISSDYSVSDASFIRLKNVSLSWTLPSELTSRIKMRSARVFALGQNLMTFTNYIGLDPETQNSRILPPLRTVTMGVELSF